MRQIDLHLKPNFHIYLSTYSLLRASQRVLVVKNLPANAGDAGLIPGSGRSPGVGNGNPLQYSCLGNPMDRGARWATVHGVTKRWSNSMKLSHALWGHPRRAGYGGEV